MREENEVMKIIYLRVVSLVLVIAMLFSLSACTARQFAVPASAPTFVSNSDLSATDIPDKSHECNPAFFMDETFSMLGFSSGIEYKTTLNEIRSLLIEQHPAETVDLFRYDLIVDQISDSVFTGYYNTTKLNCKTYYDSNLPSKSKKTAYAKVSGKGIVKPLELVLNYIFDDTAYGNGLCVISTDGYEQQRDYAVLFEKLNGAMAENKAVAFIGIKSYFNGTVYHTDNADGSYTYKGERMFYLYVFGEDSRVIEFSEALSVRLSEKNIENYVELFLPKGTIEEIVPESITIMPETAEINEVENSFGGVVDNSSLVLENGENTNPTLSAKLFARNEFARCVFAADAIYSTDSAQPSLYADTEIFLYRGAVRREDGIVSDLILEEAPYQLTKSIETVATVGEDGRVLVSTTFTDLPLFQAEKSALLIKYTLHPGQTDNVPEWITANSTSDCTSKSERGKTLDLKNLYAGLNAGRNTALAESEYVTFYCYYTI